MIPLSLFLDEFTDDCEILVSGLEHGVHWIAIHDHSKSWGEAEIFTIYYAPIEELRHMWEQNNMETIELLLALTRQLEKDIQETVNQLITDYRKLTGLSPMGIYFEMADVSTIRSYSKHYVLVSVNVDEKL